MSEPMILRTSNKDVIVGQIYRPKHYVTFENVEHPPQPLFILREATYDEWVTTNPDFAHEDGMKYYEVHVD